MTSTAGVDGGNMGDDLFNDAKEVVAQAGKASASLLQRRLRVGYARAARLLDLLEEKGIIGPGEGAKPREVYIGPSVGSGLGKGGGVPPTQDNFVDDGSVAEVVSSDSKLDDKIAVEE
ncbi:MAG: hypothetical protein HYW38_01810 [Candidatus Colwellbacteria bacterium]|nr:hypothetical protein [Candidatus Colwellbacteria bacterium]